MSWRGGKSDWEEPKGGHRESRGGHSRNDSYRSSEQNDKWPSRDHQGGRNYSREGDSGRYQHDRRDHRSGDREEGAWKHDRYDDHHSRERRTSGRDERWPSSGSWGNVNERNKGRDRSRSPQRDRSHRSGGGHRNRHDSYSQEEAYSYRGRGYNSNRERQDDGYSNNQRGAQQGKWPDNNQQQYDGSYGYHEPSATLKVSNVPEWLTSERIRGALEGMEIGVRSCQVSGDWSGLGYIELGRVSDATYLVDECKGHLMVGDQCLYVEYADTSNIKAPQDPNYHTGHSYGGPNYHKNFPTEPTDTMIVRNLDLESTEDSIRAAFQYITKKPILDIRLAKDKFTGNSRGFSFISWSSIDDCKQVLDYLQNATPKFKIDDRVVILDYANGLPGKTQDLKQQAANDAIAAATAIKTSWTDPNQLVGGAAALLKQTANQQGIAPHLTPHLYPKLPAEIGLKAPPLGMIPPIPPDQIPPQRDASGRYRKYQNPDYSMFQWMATHQMYYDPRTGLMWCVKKMQFYNQYTQQYLDWDPTQDTFVPVDHINIDAVADQPATTGAFKTKEKKKLTQATDVQKQMESWMRQQKKSKAKPMSQAEADAIRRSKKEAHANKFSAAGFGMSFNSSPMVQRQKSHVNQGAVDMEEEGPPAPPRMDDMFEDAPAPPPPVQEMSVVPAGPAIPTEREKRSAGQSQEDEHINWAENQCLLCRRAFKEVDQLTKHIKKSKLHKENLAKIAPLQEEEEEEETDAYKAVMAMGHSVPSYRDRASERRNKFGNRQLSGYEHRRDEEDQPVEQPTAHGIGTDNKGSKLLQKMGWQAGTGLGKNQQGIVNPISAGEVRENKNAGLGAGEVTTRMPRYGADYKKKIQKMTMNRWNDMQ